MGQDLTAECPSKTSGIDVKQINCLKIAGELEMRLELDDISVHVSKNATDKNVCQSEKMTQTDLDLLGRDSFNNDRGGFRTTPNGTSPCNHPTLSCQVSHIQ